MELVSKFIVELTAELDKVENPVEKDMLHSVLHKLRDEQDSFELFNSGKDKEQYSIALAYLSCADPHAYIQGLDGKEIGKIGRSLQARFLHHPNRKVYAALISEKLAEYRKIELEKQQIESNRVLEHFLNCEDPQAHLKQLSDEELTSLRHDLENEQMLEEHRYHFDYDYRYRMTVLATDIRLSNGDPYYWW